MKYNYKLCPKCGKYKDMPDGTIIATNTTVNPFCVCLETLAEQQGVKPFDAAKIGTFPDCPIIEHPDYSCAACVEKDARVAELEDALKRIIGDTTCAECISILDDPYVQSVEDCDEKDECPIYIAARALKGGE